MRRDGRSRLLGIRRRLLAGAVAGLYLPASQRTIALVMGFGGGVLISALAFELTAEAYARGGGNAVVAGLAAGGLVFFAGDWVIDRRGGNHRKRSGFTTAFLLSTIE